MVKYSKIKGYITNGAIEIFSHLYQWVEEAKDNPIIILIHAYDGEPTIFKGYIYNKTKQYKPVDILDKELEDVEICVGKLKVLEFKEFIANTLLDSEFYHSFEILNKESE